MGYSACLAAPLADSFAVVTATSSSLRLTSLASVIALAYSAFSSASFAFYLASFSCFSACSITSLGVTGAGGGGLVFGAGLVYIGGGTGAGGSYPGKGFLGLFIIGLGYGFGGAFNGSSASDSFLGAEMFLSLDISLVVGIGRTPS